MWNGNIVQNISCETDYKSQYYSNCPALGRGCLCDMYTLKCAKIAIDIALVSRVGGTSLLVGIVTKLDSTLSDYFPIVSETFLVKLYILLFTDFLFFILFSFSFHFSSVFIFFSSQARFPVSIADFHEPGSESSQGFPALHRWSKSFLQKIWSHNPKLAGVLSWLLSRSSASWGVELLTLTSLAHSTKVSTFVPWLISYSINTIINLFVKNFLQLQMHKTCLPTVCLPNVTIMLSKA